MVSFILGAQSEPLSTIEVYDSEKIVNYKQTVLSQLE
jgi:hypothetical protein